MLLLDTQAVLWWLSDDPRLSDAAAAAITTADRPSLVSVASIWEIEIKRAKGKYRGPRLTEHLPAAGILVLDITANHAEHAAHLPAHHADPFDRMIVAQAILEGRRLVTSDSALSSYGAPIVW